MTFRLDWTTQENQISSKQFSIPDITCINLVLNHFNILLNLPNVIKIVLSKLQQPKTVLLKIFCISYLVLIKISYAKTAILQFNDK